MIALLILAVFNLFEEVNHSNMERGEGEGARREINKQSRQYIT